MSAIRSAVKKTLGFSFRFVPKVRRAIEQGLTVFVFHEVSDQPSPFAKQYDLAVSTRTFRRQIQWIQSNFNVIHPADLLTGAHLPRRAALISFDDGFRGSFENGLAILEQLSVPSILFVNMQAILEKKPILSATACFLDRHVPAFADFARSVGLSRPFHLTLSPSILQDFERRHGPIDQDAVLRYQGAFADLDVMKKWDGKALVAFGNHLFDHWNAAALSADELAEQYQKNEAALSSLKSRVNLFAFTNGQPSTCYSDRDVAILKRLGAGKVFSAASGVNADPSKFLLGRLSVAESDKDADHLWFRIGRAVLNNPTRSQ